MGECWREIQRGDWFFGACRGDFFVFLPKLIRRAMKADVDSVIEIFGKNEQVKSVFWAVFAAGPGISWLRALTCQQRSRLSG